MRMVAAIEHLSFGPIPIGMSASIDPVRRSSKGWLLSPDGGLKRELLLLDLKWVFALPFPTNLPSGLRDLHQSL
jgi:hypothetical protein